VVMGMATLALAILAYLIAKTGGKDFTDGYGRWRDRK
jgi:hypothetical protein